MHIKDISSISTLDADSDILVIADGAAFGAYY